MPTSPQYVVIPATAGPSADDSQAADRFGPTIVFRWILLLFAVTALAGCWASDQTPPLEQQPESQTSDAHNAEFQRPRTHGDARERVQPAQYSDATEREVERCRRIYETLDIEIAGQAAHVSVASVGLVEFRSGKIAFHDFAFQDGASIRLAGNIEPGSYPVDFSYVAFEDGLRRNVAAWIRIADPSNVERWTRVTRQDGSDHRLTIKGGCLAMFDVTTIPRGPIERGARKLWTPSLETRARLRRQFLSSAELGGGVFADSINLNDGAAVDDSKNLVFFVCESDAHQLAMFWGLDREGKPVALLIDFHLMD